MDKREKELERVNYHCHCERCGHAVGPAAAYVAEALERGLVRLGISDHLPFPGDSVGVRMPYAQLEDYLRELTELREAVRPKLELFRGFEGEYFRKHRDYYEWLLGREDCDYLILGQHYYRTEDGALCNVAELTHTAQYEQYAASVVEAMRTGYFRYVAHPDTIFQNPLAWDDHCERACDIIIDGAVKYGFPLEYNASGLRRKKRMFPDGERYAYPHDRFWDKVAQAQADVYVGADSHEPAHVYDDKVLLAYENLREKGITPRTDW